MKNKILAVIILVTSLLTACTPETITPGNCTSTCGMITDDGIDGDCYWIEIRNECSENIKRFCLTPGDWVTAFPGDYYCISNTEPW